MAITKNISTARTYKTTHAQGFFYFFNVLLEAVIYHRQRKMNLRKLLAVYKNAPKAISMHTGDLYSLRTASCHITPQLTGSLHRAAKRNFRVKLVVTLFHPVITKFAHPPYSDNMNRGLLSKINHTEWSMN